MAEALVVTKPPERIFRLVTDRASELPTTTTLSHSPMKVSTPAFILLAFVASFAFGATRDAAKIQYKTTKIADHLHVLSWTGANIANISVLVGDDGVLLVDTGFPETVEKLRAAVADLSPRPIRIVLNTNQHFDHADGNARLAEAGAIIMAHQQSRQRMLAEQRLPEFSAKIVFAPYPPSALPVVTCRESLTVHFNGEEIRALHIPNAHSDSDLLYHFVNSNVLHAGDLFFPNAIPFIAFSGGGSIAGMIIAADRILELCDANTRIIPGHGPVSSASEVRAFRELLITIRDRLNQAIQSGKTIDEIVEDNPLADLYASRRSFFKPDALTRYGVIDLVNSKGSRR